MCSGIHRTLEQHISLFIPVQHLVNGTHGLERPHQRLSHSFLLISLLSGFQIIVGGSVLVLRQQSLCHGIRTGSPYLIAPGGVSGVN